MNDVLMRDHDAIIADFLTHCHHRTYPAKHIVIREGDSSTELFYLIKGSVTVLTENDTGREIVLAYLNAGEFFGEMGLFDEQLKRSALVRTKTTCEIAQISYTRLKRLHEIFPGLLFSIGSQLAIRLRRTSRKVSDLTFMDVKGRLARTLLELCQEPDAITHPDGMLIRITRLELGRIIGCSREMVGRILKDLEEDHLVSVSGKSIVVFGARQGKDSGV